MKPYYEHGGQTIYLADSREILTGPGMVADAVCTDPPYGVELKQRVHKGARKPGNYTKFDDTPDYVRSVVVPVLQSALRLAPRGAVTPGRRCMFMYPEPYDVGWVWEPAGAGQARWGFACGQPIYYYGKDPYLATGRGSRPSGWTGGERAVDNGHPCPKPISLMRFLVERVSLPGELVLDPFLGSGTTLVACKLVGRRGVGVELEEKYCEIAAKRLDQGVLF